MSINLLLKTVPCKNGQISVAEHGQPLQEKCVLKTVEDLLMGHISIETC